MRSLSSNWENTYLNVQANSAAWAVDTIYDDSFIQANSAAWAVDNDTIYDDSLIQSTSGDWNSSYTTVNSNSAVWTEGGAGTIINNYSSLASPVLFNPDVAGLSANSDDFTLPNANSVQLVTHNGQVLDDSEYTQVTTTLTVSPDNGFDTTADEVLVYQTTFPVPSVFGLVLNISEKTTNYTVVDTDYTILGNASGGNITITLIPASPALGKIYNIKKIDSSSNTVTVNGNLSETIDGGTTAILTTQYESITIQCDGGAWWII